MILTTFLPISDIIVRDRQRLDVGDINALAISMREHGGFPKGQLQPILVNQDKRVVDGRRRLEAAKQLGWTEILVCYRETLTEDELQELELEADVQRKDRTWQEKVIAIAKIHQLKSRAHNYNNSEWGQRETGALLGLHQTRVSFATRIAPLLLAELDAKTNKPKEGARFWLCDSLEAAWRLLLRDKEDEAMRLLAAIKVPADIERATNAAIEATELDDNLLAFERERYESNPLNTKPFEVYWQEKQALDARIRPNATIDLSSKLHLGDCIAFMRSHPGAFDHIITDPPYGIDMENLNQQNPHGRMTDLDTVEKEHDVDANRALLAEFFPAAFHCTKEHAMVIAWCDAMLWQYMYDKATAAGFSVQRWPYVWCKTSSCMNQCANQNRTKNIEFAMLCRKPGTALAQPTGSSFLVTGKDELCEKIGHKFAKPFACWEDLIKCATLEGQTILEPFAGHGSGVISLLTLKRKVVAVELQQNHYNYLVENVKQFYLTQFPGCQFV